MNNKYFIVIGMPRCGTTYLYHNLNNHPNVFLPYRKEVNYFNINYKKGEKWYRGLYDEAKGDQIKGDISPPCFLDRDSIGRTKSFEAEMKYILVVRNPAEYAVSFYEQFNTAFYDLPEFEKFLKNGYKYKMGSESLDVLHTNHYVKETIELYMKQLGKNLLVYDFDFFRKNSLFVLQQIENFLEIPNYFNEDTFDPKKINSGDRGNIKFIQNILANENVITFLEKTFPRSFIIKMRSYYDSICSNLKPKEQNEETKAIKEKNKELANEFLKSDVDWYKEFFKDGQVKLGDGTVLTKDT